MAKSIFRFVKNIMYKQLYDNIEMMKKDLIEIIKSEKLNMSLKKLYKETLNKYLMFINENKNFNLNQ